MYPLWQRRMTSMRHSGMSSCLISLSFFIAADSMKARVNAPQSVAFSWVALFVCMMANCDSSSTVGAPRRRDRWKRNSTIFLLIAEQSVGGDRLSYWKIVLEDMSAASRHQWPELAEPEWMGKSTTSLEKKVGALAATS